MNLCPPPKMRLAAKTLRALLLQGIALINVEIPTIIYGSYSKNDQNTGRELMIPDEVRMLDNRYALLFIRGERPAKDLKYDILHHPNVALSADGKAEPYAHGDTSGAVNTIELTFDAQLPEDLPEIQYMGYELLSEEDVEREIAAKEKEAKSINGKQE